MVVGLMLGPNCLDGGFGRVIELDSSVLRLRNLLRLERRADVAARPTQSALQAITESEPALQERRHQPEEELPPGELQQEEPQQQVLQREEPRREEELQPALPSWRRRPTTSTPSTLRESILRSCDLSP